MKKHFALYILLLLPLNLRAEPTPLSTQRSLDLITQAQEKYKYAYYPEVIEITQNLLSREGLTLKDIGEVYYLQASSKIILGDVLGAERDYKTLLSLKPGFELPKNASPKIIQAFRKVHFEVVEKKKAAQNKTIQDIIRRLELRDSMPREHVGGLPLTFAFKLNDPGAWVQKVELNYRKKGDDEFSSLVLKKGQQAVWQATLPGKWTENDEGGHIQYFVSTYNENEKDLVQLGAAKAPRGIKLLPGTLNDHLPIYRRVWFWSAVAGVVGSAVASYFIIKDQTELEGDVVAF